MKKDWTNSILKLGATIEDGILSLNNSALKIILAINENGIFQGTVSDGDIRRALLQGYTIKSCIDEIINRKAVYVSQYSDKSTVQSLMLKRGVQQIPIVNDSKRLVGLHLWDDLFEIKNHPNLFLIMAGGMGKRLKPHTDQCPKPMLQVDGKPILEHIIKRASDQGFTQFSIAVNYLGDHIKNYFEDGSNFGVKITYINENIPLGTVGAMGLLESLPREPMIVMNGDIYTDLDFSSLLKFHYDNNADATMVVRTHEWQNPYGEVRLDGLQIAGFEEKPIIRSYVNAGIYVVNPDAVNFLNKNEYCDMPDFFETLRSNSKNTIAYRMNDSWIDIGRPIDLERAAELSKK